METIDLRDIHRWCDFAIDYYWKNEWRFQVGTLPEPPPHLKSYIKDLLAYKGYIFYSGNCVDGAWVSRVDQREPMYAYYDSRTGETTGQLGSTGPLLIPFVWSKNHAAKEDNKDQHKRVVVV